MLSIPRHRRGLRVLAFALVLLGICVFAWGLRYKLSLYDAPHAIGQRVPAAKLLTGKERSALPVVDLRHAPSPAAPLALTGMAMAFFVLMGAKLFPGFSVRMPQRDIVSIGLPRALLQAHFTRPPPRLR
ncbi:MAG: hypothetical protein WA294_07265 [Acidobacteriaceae bacterium]